MAKVKLDEIVSSLLNEMDSSIHHKRRLYDIGVDILRLLNLDVLGKIKTEIVNVNKNRTVSFPQDYINYLKIGVSNSRGEIATFTRNKDLAMYNSMGNNRSLPDQLKESDDDYFCADYRNYNMNGGTYKIFGIGSDANIGEFRVDNENRYFVFGQNFNYGNIIIEYLSNEIDDDGEFYVDERLEEAVKAGIYWKSILRLKNFSLSEKAQAKAEWITEKRKAKSRVNPFRISEANDVTRKTIKLAIKH